MEQMFDTDGGLADLHVHTSYSDGRDSPVDVVEHAHRLGFDVIAITDHDTIAGAQIAARFAARWPGSPSVIMGEEVSSRDGHILGLFLRERVPPGMSAADTIAAIHERGGLAVAAHPFWRRAAVNRRGWRGSVGDLVRRLPFDAVELVNGGPTPDMWHANRTAHAANRTTRRPAVGGSDAHVKEAMGWAHTAFPGRGPDDLRRAILRGATQPRRRPLGVTGLARYAAWGLNHRPGALVESGAS
jgi:predicted metal-dependent phosphoesterase TrpH